MVLLQCSCASFNPKNETPEAIAQLENDSRTCMDQATRNQANEKGPVAGLIVGAFIGATDGVVWGAHHGNAGEGAWIGAAVGAGAGFLLGFGKAIYDSNVSFRQCMERRSYVAAY
jgi:hypothetical protein